MSAQGFAATNDFDAVGNPAGGSVVGRGITIVWQNGGLVWNGVRQEPNGAFVEDVIAAAKQRLEHYQTTKFACGENASAINALTEALQCLECRTANRELRGVEGTHEL